MVENGHFIEFFCPPLRTFKTLKSQQKREKHAKSFNASYSLIINLLE